MTRLGVSKAGGGASGDAVRAAQFDLLYWQIGQLKAENDFCHESSANKPRPNAYSWSGCVLRR